MSIHQFLSILLQKHSAQVTHTNLHHYSQPKTVIQYNSDTEVVLDSESKSLTPGLHIFKFSTPKTKRTMFHWSHHSQETGLSVQSHLSVSSLRCIKLIPESKVKFKTNVRTWSILVTDGNVTIQTSSRGHCHSRLEAAVSVVSNWRVHLWSGTWALCHRIVPAYPSKKSHALEVIGF